MPIEPFEAHPAHWMALPAELMQAVLLTKAGTMASLGKETESPLAFRSTTLEAAPSERSPAVVDSGPAHASDVAYLDGPGTRSPLNQDAVGWGGSIAVLERVRTR